MIDAIAQHNPPLRLQHRFLKKSCRSPRVLEAVAAYLAAYCDHGGISAAETSAAIDKFVARYQRDLTAFQKTGRYPRELGQDDFDLSRTEYDLFLIASMLFTRHRFRIAELLAGQEPSRAAAAFIGVGSGVELALAPRARHSVAFDLSVSDFVRGRFPGVVFQERHFTGGQEAAYDVVYAIELLEHLDDPQALLRDVHAALVPGGTFVCTIAVNVPQFDHALNMEAGAFEAAVSELFAVRYMERIPHDYRMSGIDAENVMYHLERKAK